MAAKRDKRDARDGPAPVVADAAAAEPAAPAASPEQKAASTKRKPVVEELEVDLAAPEPPSKRARRALKKGKTLPAAAADDDDDDDDADADEADGNKEKVRSQHSIWVGNLPFSATPDMLRRWFVDNSGGAVAAESITRVKLPVSKEPGRDKSQKPANKGFAYVDFADVGPKVAAMALSESDFGGRKLLIKDAASFEGRPAKAARDEGAGAEGAPPSKAEANASRKVFVGNLGFKTTEDDLHRHFEKCGEIEWAKLATFEDSGKCKGFGWVKFKEPEAAAWAVKGFVKIKERIETEDDFGDGSGEDADGGAQAQPQKQFKTRKWWVNRMLGRQLKLELAEDDQTRYKKRFTKGGQGGGGGQGGPKAPRPDKAAGDAPKAREGKPSAEELQAARLMGNVVAHTGTKLTFD